MRTILEILSVWSQINVSKRYWEIVLVRYNIRMCPNDTWKQDQFVIWKWCQNDTGKQCLFDNCLLSRTNIESDVSMIWSFCIPDRYWPRISIRYWMMAGMISYRSKISTWVTTWIYILYLMYINSRNILEVLSTSLLPKKAILDL